MNAPNKPTQDSPQKLSKLPLAVRAFGEAILQQAREVAYQIEQRVYQAIRKENDPAK